MVGDFQFTKEQTEHFEKILDAYHPEFIKGFLLQLEALCGWAIDKTGAKGVEDRRDDLGQMSKSFKTALKHLEDIYTDKKRIPFLRDLDFDDQAPPLSEKEMKTFPDTVRSQKHALAAAGHLEILIEMLTEYGESSGARGERPRPMSQFAKQIGESFYQSFGTPSWGKNEPLERIIYEVFEIVAPYPDEEKVKGKVRDLRGTIDTLKEHLANKPNKEPVPRDYVAPPRED